MDRQRGGLGYVSPVYWATSNSSALAFFLTGTAMVVAVKVKCAFRKRAGNQGLFDFLGGGCGLWILLNMPGTTYRLSFPITVVAQDAKRFRLRQLPAGSVLICTSSQTDAGGMIRASCNGSAVIVFERDLEECAEPILTSSGSTTTAPNFAHARDDKAQQ
jgi:hypothetical protein